MGDSAGRIDLDLNINRRGFDQQLSGLQGLAKKAGAALAGAFAVKTLVDFGAQCIALGSDLQEVQNVVDVTFPRMSAQVDKFAQNAASAFGLSETMAKKFTGTFGAMAKAFGFNEQASYEMSTALTGLSGDVASFYNISQDEAFTKLKSVFTGETESLKDLGVVMTQAALDQYALANGYGKTTQAMSEGEKVGLRYKFVTDQLSLASGDFIRTSDGWANQVRVLKLQFDSLKATIGQGLINVLTPVIKVINTIIGKLMSLANAFKSLTEMITGKKGSGGTAKTVSGMEEVAASATGAAGAMDDVGGSAAAAGKAGKQAKSGLSGLDKLNVLTDSGDGGGGGGTGNGGGYSADEFDMGSIDSEPVNQMDSKFQGLLDKAKDLAGLFKRGFFNGLGDITVFDSIRESIEGIGTSLKNIFMDDAVVGAADRFLSSFVLNLGKEVGSMVSIGASLADNLLGGINLYLKQSSERIKDWIVSMFDIGSEIADIRGNFATAAAKIFEAFRSDDAKQVTADIIGIFAETSMVLTETMAKAGRDMLDMITKPFIENQDKIKNTLEGMFSTAADVLDTVRTVFENTGDKISKVYDEHIGPMFTTLGNGLSDIVSAFLDAYNTYLQPVLDELGDKFSTFAQKHMQPFINGFLDLVGSVADLISSLWENILTPLFSWLIETFIKQLAEDLSWLPDVIGSVVEAFMDAATLTFEQLQAVLDFLSLVFKGDWETIWNNIKAFLDGIWNGICTGVSEAIGKMQNAISEGLGLVKEKWDEIWGGLDESTRSLLSGMGEFIRGTINTILKGIETMANGIVKGVNKVIDALNGLDVDMPAWAEKLTGVGSIGFDIQPIQSVSIPKLATGGYVEANTPQLAMIGDNRHQGEVVAPENKLQEMLDRAVKGGGSDLITAEMILLLRDMKGLLKVISQKESAAMPSQREVYNMTRAENNILIRRHGASGLV